MYPRGPYWCGFPPPRHRGFAAPVGRGGWHFMHVVGLAAHGFAIPRTGVQLLGDLATAWAFAMATRRIKRAAAGDALLHPCKHLQEASHKASHDAQNCASGGRIRA